jgi:hypothetical protein
VAFGALGVAWVALLLMVLSSSFAARSPGSLMQGPIHLQHPVHHSSFPMKPRYLVPWLRGVTPPQVTSPHESASRSPLPCSALPSHAYRSPNCLQIVSAITMAVQGADSACHPPSSSIDARGGARPGLAPAAAAPIKTATPWWLLTQVGQRVFCKPNVFDAICMHTCHHECRGVVTGVDFERLRRTEVLAMWGHAIALSHWQASTQGGARI